MKFFIFCPETPIITGIGVAVILVTVLHASPSFNRNNNITSKNYGPVILNLNRHSRDTNTSVGEDKNRLTICVHDGIFHCDEVMSCYLLKILHPNANIIRSRDPKIVRNSDIVLDVGNIYDSKRNRFDHHQQDFNETMSSLSTYIRSSIKLSSAGLIYHHFGRSILEKIIGKIDEHALNYTYKHLYYGLIQEIDGIDNGISPYLPRPPYCISSHLNSRVSRLNKPWRNAENWNETEQFQRAMDLVGAEFRERVKYILEQKYPGREIAQRALENRYNLHHSGKIIELEMHCPWRNHVYELEKQLKIQPQIQFVLFEADDNFRIQCVPSLEENFRCRKYLPKSWRGLRDKVLSKEAGIEGCVFVHVTGFIGGHKSREGVLRMAEKSIEDDAVSDPSSAGNVTLSMRINSTDMKQVSENTL